MTTYLPDNTPRLKVHYQGPRGQHTILFRALATDAPFVNAVNSALTTIAQLGIFWNGTTFDSAQVAAEGSNVFVPFPGWTPIVVPSAGIPSAGDPDETRAYGLSISINGRTTAGHRVRYFLFNTFYNTDRDSRTTAAEFPGVASIISAFNTLVALSAPHTLSGIDHLPIAALYPFVDININKRIARRARRLG